MTAKLRDGRQTYTRRQFRIMKGLVKGLDWDEACEAAQRAEKWDDPEDDPDEVKTYSQWEGVPHVALAGEVSEGDGSP